MRPNECNSGRLAAFALVVAAPTLRGLERVEGRPSFSLLSRLYIRKSETGVKRNMTRYDY